MEIEKVEEYISESSRALNDTGDLDEANTKSKTLRPFVEDVLDWDIIADVEMEYAVKSGSGKHKVDYALIPGSQPEIFIEAKSQGTGLKQKYREQLASYMKTDNVDWGILSNGERFQFLQRTVNNGNVSVELVEDRRIQEITEVLDLLAIFHKDETETDYTKEEADENSGEPEWGALAEAIYQEEDNWEEKIIGFYQGMPYDDYIELFKDKNNNGRRLGRADRALNRHNKKSGEEIDTLLFTTKPINEDCIELAEKHGVKFMVAKRIGEGVFSDNEEELRESTDVELFTYEDVEKKEEESISQTG